MQISDTPIVSRDVSKRASEESLLKKTQQKQLEKRLVEQPAHAWRQSLDASGDTYIAEALRKVRQSKITHPEALTRMSGTWIHNQKMNTPEENE